MQTCLRPVPSVSKNCIWPCVSRADSGPALHPAAVKPPRPSHPVQVPGFARGKAPVVGWKCLSLCTLTHHLKGDLFGLFEKRSGARMIDWIGANCLAQLHLLFNIMLQLQLGKDFSVAWLTWCGEQTLDSSKVHRLLVLKIHHAVDWQHLGLQGYYVGETHDGCQHLLGPLQGRTLACPCLHHKHAWGIMTEFISRKSKYPLAIWIWEANMSWLNSCSGRRDDLSRYTCTLAALT